MAAPFRVLTTETFEWHARKAIRGKRELAGVIEKLIPILRDDPYNLTGTHKIKKLVGVEAVTSSCITGLDADYTDWD